MYNLQWGGDLISAIQRIIVIWRGTSKGAFLEWSFHILRLEMEYPLRYNLISLTGFNSCESSNSALFMGGGGGGSSCTWVLKIWFKVTLWEGHNPQLYTHTCWRTSECPCAGPLKHGFCKRSNLFRKCMAE